MQVTIIDSSQNQLNHKEKDKESNIKEVSNYIFLSVLQLKCTTICPSPNMTQVLHKSTCPSLYLTTKLASQATCVSFTPWHLGRLHKLKFDNYNYNTTQPHFTLKIYKMPLVEALTTRSYPILFTIIPHKFNTIFTTQDIYKVLPIS